MHATDETPYSKIQHCESAKKIKYPKMYLSIKNSNREQSSQSPVMSNCFLPLNKFPKSKQIPPSLSIRMAPVIVV